MREALKKMFGVGKKDEQIDRLMEALERSLNREAELTEMVRKSQERQKDDLYALEHLMQSTTSLLERAEEAEERVQKVEAVNRSLRGEIDAWKQWSHSLEEEGASTVVEWTDERDLSIGLIRTIDTAIRNYALMTNLPVLEK